MASLGEKLKHELSELIPVTAFFLVSFQLLALTESLILRGHGLRVSTFMAAAVGALVVSKVVLVVDHLPLVNRFPHKPLAYNAIWKTFIYFAAALVARYAEHLIHFWRQTGSATEANRRLFAEIPWPYFWAVQLWLFVLLLVYCATRELVRAVGRTHVLNLFFRREAMNQAKVIVLIVLGLLTLGHTATAQDALPSWNDSTAKKSIVVFVEKVTKEGSPDFVPPAERIATFDNDGCLWAEQPMYFQAFFIFDRIKALAPKHPEWKDKEPFASVLKGDLKSALAGGEHALLEMAMATHAGITTDEFDAIVKEWTATARHPTTKKPYIEMVYQPMLELLAYLRAHGFKTYIVSGGGIEFMRPWSERVYGIPPEQVIGSSIKTKFQMRDGKPVLLKLPELNFIDDKAGKPAAIQHHIGRRPIMAFGNSDGDLQMLQWTAAGTGPRFCLYVHHTDSQREWAYDRQSSVGRLDKGLDEARARDWTVVDMKQDWKTIFPSEVK